MSSDRRSRLPSLMALRAFDAASQVSSFTRAAENLSLTQSAISRHIRNLEDDLEIQLFHRKGREITLTKDGESLKEVVADAFERLSTGIESIRQAKLTPKLTVSLLPSVATKWLVPRIGKFTSDNPEVELQIHCSRALSDLKREGIDIAIRYGEGNWPGCHAELLMEETITPVCSPKWLDKLGERPTLEQLSLLPLLHGDIPEQWDSWLDAVGVSNIETSGSARMTDDNALIQAAIDGHGVILGRSALVANDIAEGRLVAPFAVSTPSVYSYWLVSAEADCKEPMIEKFREFVMGEAVKDGY